MLPIWVIRNRGTFKCTPVKGNLNFRNNIYIYYIVIYYGYTIRIVVNKWMSGWTDNWNGKHQQLWLSPGFAVRGPESGRAVKEGLANVSHKPCNSSRKVKAVKAINMAGN